MARAREWHHSPMARAHAARPAIIKVWLVTFDHSGRVPKDFVSGQQNIVLWTAGQPKPFLGQDQASRISELTYAYELVLGKFFDHGYSDAAVICALSVMVHCVPALLPELDHDLTGVDKGYELGVHFQEDKTRVANQDVTPPIGTPLLHGVAQHACLSLLCIRDVRVNGNSRGVAISPEVYGLIPVYDVH